MAKVTIGVLARSVGWAGTASFWQIGSRVILTPLILASISLDGYGVWVLLFTISGSADLVAASFGLTYAKFTAEYDARGDWDRLNQLIGSAVLLIGGSAVVILSAVVFARAPILAMLGVAPDLRATAGEALIVVAVTTLLRMSLGGVTQIVAGLQRTDVLYRSAILSSVIYFGLAVFLLKLGWGLYGLATSNLIGEAAAIAYCWVWCRRLRPEIRLSPLRATRSGLAQVIALGGRFQVLALLTRLSSMAFQFLLSSLLGTAILGTYNLAMRLIRLGEASVNAVVAPMMPAFAYLHSETDNARVDALHHHGSRILFVMALLSFGFLCVFANPLILAWTNSSLPSAAWTLQVLVPAFLAKSLTGMGTASLRARGTVALEVKFNLVTFVATWGLLLPLALLLPAVGAGGPSWLWISEEPTYSAFVFAASLGLLLGGAWFVGSFARAEAIDVSQYLGVVLLRPLVVLCPIIILISELQQYVAIPPLLPSPRWALLVEICLWGVLYSFLGVISSWFLILSRGERAAIVGRIRGRSRERESATK